MVSKRAERRNTNDLENSREKVNAPSHFICCLTLDIMCDPVTTPKGYTFERQAVTQWLQRGDKTCPLSREPLQESELVSNTHLRETIRKWKRSKGIPTYSTSDYDEPLLKKVMQRPHLVGVRERILSRREQQYKGRLSASC